MNRLRRPGVAFIAAAIPAAALIAGVASVAVHLATISSVHFADADNPRVTARGRQLYAQFCASCHGRYLQGQPLWQLVDQDSARRAPALDQTGYVWMRSGEDAFRITKFGVLRAAETDRVSSMPAFESRLADRDILAIIAFMDARWPKGLRVLHARLNPDFVGVLSNADEVDWRLPRWCAPPDNPEMP